MKDNQTLYRYEFKYLVNEKVSEQIKENVIKFMNVDEFARKMNSNSYFVSSIYFEDNFNTNFTEKIDGNKIRKKFRIRNYSKDLNNDPIFLEVKGRNLDRTFKKRTKIDYEDIITINNRRNINSLLKKYPNNDIINQFIFEFYKKNLKPKIIVDYSRTPFANSQGLYFRLTFDKKISSAKINNNLLDNIVYNQHVLCKAGFTILEVKFDRSIPLWFHRIIQTFELNRVSISKFVVGMCYLKLGTETSE